MSIRAHASLRLVAEAAVPFLSQLSFSAVSFLAISGMARQFPPAEIATVIAAYSVESIAVSWGNARWVLLLLARETREPRRGDIDIIARGIVRLLVVATVPMFLAGLLASRSVAVAAAATVWAGAMMVGDLSRFAASRYLGLAPVLTIGGLYTAIASGLTFRPAAFPAYLALLGIASFLHGVGHVAWWRQQAKPGRSSVWETDRAFGRAFAFESLSTSTSVGLGGVAVSALNPVLAVGLQLGNQILLMPAVMIAQALSLPLTKRGVKVFSEGRYPLTLVRLGVVVGLTIPLAGVVLLVMLRGSVSVLLGDSTDYAYFFLPVVAAQALTILPWQPVAAARRWTDGPARTSRHVALTFAVSQLGIAVAAGVFHEPHALRAAVLALLVAVWLSVAVRLVQWIQEGRDWVAPVDTTVQGGGTSRAPGP